MSLIAGKAEVTFDPDMISAADMAELIADLGFSATVVEAAAPNHSSLDLRVSESLSLQP